LSCQVSNSYYINLGLDGYLLSSDSGLAPNSVALN
jgi:hypothetical protein